MSEKEFIPLLFFSFFILVDKRKLLTATSIAEVVCMPVVNTIVFNQINCLIDIDDGMRRLTVFR